MLSKANGNYTAFSVLADLVGCGHLAAEEELVCMQNTDAQTLENVYSNNTNIITFPPMADNITCYSNTTDRLANDLVTRVVSPCVLCALPSSSQLTLFNQPWIFGSNSMEGVGFGTYNPTGETAAQKATGLAAITCPVSAEIQYVDLPLCIV